MFMEKMHSRARFVVGAIALFLLVPYLSHVAGAVPGYPIVLTDEPVAPIPLELRLNPEKIVLGGELFHERALSSDGSMSCADCHRLDKGGDDQLAKMGESRAGVDDHEPGDADG